MRMPFDWRRVEQVLESFHFIQTATSTFRQKIQQIKYYWGRCHAQKLGKHAQAQKILCQMFNNFTV